MGTVLVSMPVPIPVTNRATIICGTEYAVVCRIAPTMIHTMAIHMARRRPVFSQKMKERIQPVKQPRL
jgi:hypothetical protein